METIIPKFICFGNTEAGGHDYLKGEVDKFVVPVNKDDLDFYIFYYNYIFEYIDEKI